MKRHTKLRSLMQRPAAGLPPEVAFVVLALLVAWQGAWAQPEVRLPGRPGAVRFAVIGDAGTGGNAQHQVAEQMVAYHDQLPYNFVLMLGDNLYGSEHPGAYRKKFEQPYQGLLDRGVSFHAVLGNHDQPEQRFYPLFHMNGKRYYSFAPTSEVEIFGLDSTQMDDLQLRWLEKALEQSTASWKICFLHHPPYSSGKRHGSDELLRKLLEPLFLKYGVNVVFAGHDHFYERLKPQQGIHYFVAGGAAKLRRRNIRKTPLTARGFDEDHSFLVVELDGDDLHYQAVSRTGQTVDSGRLERKPNTRASGS